METRMQTLLSTFGLENRDYRKVNSEDVFKLILHIFPHHSQNSLFALFYS